MKQLLLFAAVLTLSVSCKKNNDPTKNAVLPAATQEGKNTVGFTINGEVWVPYAKCAYFNDPCRELSTGYDVSGGSAPNAFSFQVVRKRGNTSSSLTVSSSGRGTITSVGDKVDSIGVNFTAENSVGNDGTYSGIQPGSRFIITKFDKLNQIISGEFEFILKEDNQSGKTITLKDGRFDFRFNTCHCSE